VPKHRACPHLHIVSVPVLGGQMPRLGSAVKRGRGVSEVLFQSGGLSRVNPSTCRSTSYRILRNTGFPIHQFSCSVTSLEGAVCSSFATNPSKSVKRICKLFCVGKPLLLRSEVGIFKVRGRNGEWFKKLVGVDALMRKARSYRANNSVIANLSAARA